MFGSRGERVLDEGGGRYTVALMTLCCTITVANKMVFSTPHAWVRVPLADSGISSSFWTSTHGLRLQSSSRLRVISSKAVRVSFKTGQRCWFFAITNDQVARANNPARDLTERYCEEEVTAVRSSANLELGFSCISKHGRRVKWYAHPNVFVTGAIRKALEYFSTSECG